MTTMTGAMAVRDEDILAQAQAGEEGAFARLVEAHHQSRVRVAYVVCGDVDLARDSAQAAWVRAWQRLDTIREPAKLRAWLVAIAANEARQASRSQRRRALRELPMPIEDPVGDTGVPEGADLAAALARLDPDDRGLIAMRYLAGLDSEEIAVATGRTASGVRVRLSRLLARLREDLSDD
jgi:RNA polymerase sigma-70 factor (ECF subfamily)